jgi:hypothetical protein
MKGAAFIVFIFAEALSKTRMAVSSVNMSIELVLREVLTSKKRHLC